MRAIAVAVCIAIAVACSGGSTTHPDASKIDSTVTGPPCMGVIYDPCTSSSQCMSMNCHLFNGASLQICTQSCTPGNNSTCPVDASGSNGFCNNMGICKPAVTNNCSR